MHSIIITTVDELNKRIDAKYFKKILKEFVPQDRFLIEIESDFEILDFKIAKGLYNGSKYQVLPLLFFGIANRDNVVVYKNGLVVTMPLIDEKYLKSQHLFAAAWFDKLKLLWFNAAKPLHITNNSFHKSEYCYHLHKITNEHICDKCGIRFNCPVDQKWSPYQNSFLINDFDRKREV